MGGRGNSGGGGSGGVKTINATEAFKQVKKDFLKEQEKSKNEIGVSKDISHRNDVTGGTQAQYDFIKNYVESKGWTVKKTTEIIEAPFANGATFMRQKRIEIRSDMPIGAQVKTLAHETFHALNHLRIKKTSALGKLSSRDQNGGAEMQAEAFADMVGRKMGIKDGYSSAYIESWRKIGGPYRRSYPDSDFLDASQPLLEENFNNLFGD